MEEGADLFSSFPQVDLDLIDGSYRKIDFSLTKVQLSNSHTELEWALFSSEVPISGGIQAGAGHLLSRAALGESSTG